MNQRPCAQGNAQLERGIAELDAGLGVPHDEVKRRLDHLVAQSGE